MPLAFVTVGTTEFDALIRAAVSPAVLAALRSRGIDHLLLQIGNGSFEPTVNANDDSGVRVSFYRTKPSIAQDLRNADLVIGHAGAGTCLETLEFAKPFVVVINETLHDNHQWELAEQLAADGHLLFCTPANLAETIERGELDELTPWVAGDVGRFVSWLDEFVGVRSQ
uniref:UDP-N-acetylglucosamine transferase subunit ALG13 n=1 Tax=Plectus sambesii TaxID=2011161 RepID=A0A914WMD5_9BILA